MARRQARGRKRRAQKPHRKKGRAPKDWRDRFIKAIRKHGVVGLAAQAARVDRRYAYRAKENNEEFAERWDDAIEDGLDELEARALRKARTNTTLTIFILKTRRREKYAERLELSGQLGAALVFDLPQAPRE